MAKYFIFFLAILMCSLYAVTFFENKNKVKVKILGRDRDVSLGLLLLTAFLDGAILSFILYYLLATSS
ncbi:MAG: hypothetical protein ACD_51C00278G0005 [uncultured bacterium]|nr:MAG: hypothetical protein ACD_51C00278G0005 [uncultured bacterium]OGJ47682.1 MAG: hypothetical protein A2344_01450 [Candidatus Peregrinibacteria bacterium RIFOXYB12_FULL_41_12]OGJ47840.1 MAG: hypothetical protein A2244_05160 [Candidatus Peregrinibacteria bacterium RIFOXYA2_FULL_41_18]OGJ51544.1 MAG: hypothetical protein A2336_00945 [Candidatus Peregrinibacteria bacterium RIFOXYB2_FULL_41_88]OGJ52780.1 MAG: hypothetical protein A2448_04920 [Candidatus Peregrinibacteria bacterium RIFOXYC2_FULL